MEDHDQRLKTLIQSFFPDLMELFFNTWAARIDARAAEWIDKEVFPDPPDGRRRVFDLLARVPIQPGVGPLPGNPAEMLALVHVEVEAADRTTVVKEQLWQGYARLRGKYRIPVLPVAIFVNVGLDGIGVDDFTETFGDLEVLRFRYLYVGLRALDGLQYVEGDNLLGVALAALMRVPDDRAAEVGLTALRRIAESSLDEQRRFLLADCVEAYLSLNDAAKAIFETMIGSSDFQGVQAMNKSTRELGREEGSRQIVTSQLQERFGQLPDPVLTRLRTLNEQELSRIGKALLKAQSLNELGLE